MDGIERRQSERPACFREGSFNVDHILTLFTLIEQELFAGCCLCSCFVKFKKNFNTIPHDKLWEHLKRWDVPLHLQQLVKAMYTTLCAKLCINSDTHGKVLSNMGVKQGCPLFPTLFGLYIDELENSLDKIDGDSPCLFNTLVVILLYVDIVVLLSNSWTCLQRLLNKLHEFCTSLEDNLFKTKIMIFGRNKRKLNQEIFYLDNDQIEITHKYKYIEVDFYSHWYFEPSSKRWRMPCMKALMCTSKKEAIVGVTCWELKFHLLEE